MKTLKTLAFLIIGLMLSSACKTVEDCGDGCLNGGFCVVGTCNCATGYSGDRCQTQITPSTIKIIKIEVIRMPTENADGKSFDAFGDPDLIFELVLDNTKKIIWESSNEIEDADANKMLELIPEPDLIISDQITENYSLMMYDKDIIDENEFMGGISFVPYSYTNNFPATVTLDDGGNVAFKLYYNYTVY